jgi:hypothetical protein
MYRFSMKHRGRLTQRASAVQHVAYILRDQEGPAAAHVQYMLRTSERTRGREDLIDAGHGNLPAWAEGRPMVFWEAAETWERANGRTATTWEVTLPRELTRDEQRAAIADMMQVHFGSIYPYTWALHESRALDGEVNPHFHVAFSSRMLDGIERTPAQFFSRYNAAAPAQGGARKNSRLHARGALLHQRQSWADIANWYLEHGHHTERLDHRSLERQGITREPVARLSAGELSQAKHRHTYSEGLALRQAQEETRHAVWPEENARAAKSWKERKRELGIAGVETSHATFLAAVSRHRLPRQTPAAFQAYKNERTQQRQQEFRTLQQHSARLQGEQLRYDHYTATGKTPTGTMQAHTRQLLAAGAALGVGDEEQAREKETAYVYDARGHGHDWTE